MLCSWNRSLSCKTRHKRFAGKELLTGEDGSILICFARALLASNPGHSEEGRPKQRDH